jgi:hypothetical protein
MLTETVLLLRRARKTVNLKLPGHMNHGCHAGPFPTLSGFDAQVSNDQI